MPPKIIEKKIETNTIRQAVRLKASRLEIVDSRPLHHGGISFDVGSSRLRVLSSEGDKIFAWNASDFWLRPKPLEGAAVTQVLNESVSEKFIWEVNSKWPKGVLQHRQGSFLLDQTRALFRPGGPKSQTVWTLDMGFEPDGGVVQTLEKNLVAWRILEPVFFVLPARAVRAYRVELPTESELVGVMSCAGGGAVSAENLEKGFIRLVYWSPDFDPQRIGLFDLGGELNRGDLSGFISLGDCTRFVLIGAFGLARLQVSMTP